MASFFKSFDEDNLAAADAELQSLVVAANFSPIEKHKFLVQIKKRLAENNVSLDFLESNKV